MLPFLQQYDSLTPLTSCTTCNKTAITMLSYFMSFSFTYSRKSAENKATDPPQKYSAGRISAEKLHLPAEWP